jgi:transcriptional regulator with XRE-family HTH domain
VRGTTKFNGKVLKDLIKSRGMTCNSFAEKFGVNPLTVTNWIQRGQRPSTYNLEMLANFFDVSEEVFIEDKEQITKENATEIAEETHTIFMAFQSAGFSPEQAMQLTLASMRNY